VSTPLHRWDLTPKEAVALQRELAARLDTFTPLAQCELIAGADVSYSRFSNTLYAGLVVLHAPELTIVERQGVVFETRFPYVPGLLSFREIPALLQAYEKLKTKPDVVMLDGQGYAHPRRIGFASHFGLWIDRPTIGCAKSLLIGTHKKLGDAVADRAPLVDKDEVIGMAVRTRKRAKPVFVSVGHRIDLASAVRVVLQTGKGYRLPEPTRQAHILVNELRQRAAC